MANVVIELREQRLGWVAYQRRPVGDALLLTHYAPAPDAATMREEIQRRNPGWTFTFVEAAAA